MPEPARHRAMSWLHRTEFPAQDVDSLHVSREGGIFYVCHFDARTEADGPTESEPLIGQAAVPVTPFPSTLSFSSRPGATNIIFLDFSGSNITGTAWNNDLSRTVIPALAFSTDSDYTTFSDGEQVIIKRVWQRVAEDYAPFDVDVTTVKPANWNNRVCHVLITRNTDANGLSNSAPSSGGVAYVNVFGNSNFNFYRPAWVYHNNLGNSDANIAEAASHEAGHNLGLSHDGKTDGAEYYSGHGTGFISWGPIMGTGYGRNVSQWSKGEYYLANNTQDDLAIIAGKLHYRASDHGDTRAAAAYLTVSGGTSVNATTPETDPANANPANKGVIERTNDVDVWTFNSGSGPISLTVRPWISPAASRGGNLDVVVRLLDVNGQILAISNPETNTIGVIQAVVSAGVYYLEIANTGTGSPTSSTPSGYTVYGSLGQYYITGTVSDASGVIIPPSATMPAKQISEAGTTSATFTVVYSDNIAVDADSIDNTDILITGPGSYARPATLVDRQPGTDASPITATYRMDAPGGTWDAADNGSYIVTLRSNEVFDVEGAAAPPGPLGVITAALPDVIYAATMDTTPGWTLGGGWGYGPSQGNAGDPPNVIVVGYNLSGSYNRNATVTYASTPAIDCSSTETVQLRFKRWLGIRSGDTATIQVSTNGALWTAVWSASSDVLDESWQTVQYDISTLAAGSTGVVVRWGLGSNNDNRNSYGWNIDDVEVLGVVGARDRVPPEASMFALDVTSGVGVLYEFTVTYSDEGGVSVASLGDGNIFVTGPDGYSQAAELAGVDDETDGSPRTGIYRITPPGGAWDTNDNGTYEVRLVDNTVRDVLGNAMAGASLGTFQVTIPELRLMGGSLSLSIGPDKAVTSGAAWRIATGDPTNWLASGTLVSDLDPGLYTISFADVVSWIKPDDLIVEITGGQTTEVSSAYSALTTTNFDVPLWWLQEFNYTNDPESAVLQTGANGLTLWESYIAGLNPNDPSSSLEVITPASVPTATEIVVYWEAVSGRVYSVFRADEPGRELEPVPGAQEMPWTQTSFTNTPEAPASIYQIRVRIH